MNSLPPQVLLIIFLIGSIIPMILGWKLCKSRNRPVWIGLVVPYFLSWFGLLLIYWILDAYDPKTGNYKRFDIKKGKLVDIVEPNPIKTNHNFIDRNYTNKELFVKLLIITVTISIIYLINRI